MTLLTLLSDLLLRLDNLLRWIHEHVVVHRRHDSFETTFIKKSLFCVSVRKYNRHVQKCNYTVSCIIFHCPELNCWFHIHTYMYIFRAWCINWYLYLYRNDAKIWCKEWHESKIIKHEMLTFLLRNVVYTFILLLHFPTQHPIELCILESIKTLRCKKQPFPYRLSFIMIE